MDFLLIADQYSVEINKFTLGFCETREDGVVNFLRACGYVPMSTSHGGKQWPVEKAGNSFFVPADKLVHI
ncbi:MAG: hypothetical protein WC003_16345 [Terrimicrobiaceae bacterium]